MGRGSYHHEFLRRLEAIPAHGLGLSVDVHSPPLASVRRSLQDRGVPPSYLEVFRTTTMALESVKKDVGNGLIAYHGEGLWVTQPEVTEMGAFQQAFHETVEHLLVLQSAWLNHECATKFLAGHYFGTYLPPLYIPIKCRHGEQTCQTDPTSARSTVSTGEWKYAVAAARNASADLLCRWDSVTSILF